MLRLRVLLSAVGSFALGFGLVSGCGTDAKAVDECRDIEQARCEAGATCGLVDDVDACKRFYRDHCLHGMVVESPGQATVDACVAAIRAAGTCAEGGTDTELSDCPNDVPAPTSNLATACDVVLYPERTNECSFLSEGEAPAAGGGGESSSEPGSGGAAGGGNG